MVLATTILEQDIALLERCINVSLAPITHTIHAMAAACIIYLMHIQKCAKQLPKRKPKIANAVVVAEDPHVSFDRSRRLTESSIACRNVGC